MGVTASSAREGVRLVDHSAAAQVAQPGSGRSAIAVGARDFSYVSRDVRRIGVLAITLVVLELVLWYLFAHTGVGDTVYNLVNV